MWDSQNTPPDTYVYREEIITAYFNVDVRLKKCYEWFCKRNRILFSPEIGERNWPF